jgi:hypothetical protein
VFFSCPPPKRFMMPHCRKKILKQSSKLPRLTKHKRERKEAIIASQSRSFIPWSPNKPHRRSDVKAYVDVTWQHHLSCSILFSFPWSLRLSPCRSRLIHTTDPSRRLFIPLCNHEHFFPRFAWRIFVHIQVGYYLLGEVLERQSKAEDIFSA